MCCQGRNLKPRPVLVSNKLKSDRCSSMFIMMVMVIHCNHDYFYHNNYHDNINK